ncbi:ribosome-associated translation inhibitor RaiA [Candidatus Babeliales bacterium]|nr:ribosome-associated translation inhibitor RaiA [Candidatus Babeliales bacterium]
MQVKISFQNMDHSKPLDEHANEKLVKLHEHLKKEDHNPPFYVEIWLKAHKLHPHHRAELHLKTATLNLHAHNEGADMYVAIDNVIDKMVKLVAKEQKKIKDKQKKTETDKTKFRDDKYTL